VHIKDLLCGFSTTITAIDGKQVTFSHPGPLQPNHVERFNISGMPKSESPDKRSDMLIDLFVLMPSRLNAAEKWALYKILDDCE
jgi:DnaJ-class molecular chaperone